MNVLVTGGAGFIGRWVVKQLLYQGARVSVLDDFSNGRLENLEEFKSHPSLIGIVRGDVKDQKVLQRLPFQSYDICYHLAASINVQDSIDNPESTYFNDSTATFYVLEECRKHRVKMVYMSTCMVYDQSLTDQGISEKHPVKPASPYAGAKLAGEYMVLSYFHAYGLPTVVLRPFNTYGPFQRFGGEGGVVPIFIKRKLDGNVLTIYGDGNQTRDLLYVEDCAKFVVQSGYSRRVHGEILNAGLGKDISIKGLAKLIVGDEARIKHIKHIHPQSEIQKLLCNNQKAHRLLSWEPKISLEDGIQRTENWIKKLK